MNDQIEDLFSADAELELDGTIALVHFRWDGPSGRVYDSFPIFVYHGDEGGWSTAASRGYDSQGKAQYYGAADPAPWLDHEQAGVDALIQASEFSVDLRGVTRGGDRYKVPEFLGRFHVKTRGTIGYGELRQALVDHIADDADIIGEDPKVSGDDDLHKAATKAAKIVVHLLPVSGVRKRLYSMVDKHNPDWVDTWTEAFDHTLGSPVKVVAKQVAALSEDTGVNPFTLLRQLVADIVDHYDDVDDDDGVGSMLEDLGATTLFQPDNDAVNTADDATDDGDLFMPIEDLEALALKAAGDSNIAQRMAENIDWRDKAPADIDEAEDIISRLVGEFA